MYIYKRNPDPRQKPPMGSVLNPDHSLSQGLVGCWLMNEGGGGKVYDIGRANNAAFPATDYPSWQNGAEGSELLMTNKYLDIPDNEGIKGTKISVTLSLCYTLLTNPDWYRLFSKKDNYNSVDGFEATLVNNTPTGLYVSGSSSTNIQPTLNFSWLDNKYHTITVTYDGGTATVYGDGTLAGNGSVTTLVDNTYPLCLGDYAGHDSGVRWRGPMVFAIVHQRVLTDSESLQLYAEPYANILVPQYWYMVDFGAAAGTTLNVDINDSISIAESVSELLPKLNASVFDSVSITETMD